MMTKKHYVAMAYILKDIRKADTDRGTEARDVLTYTAKALANYFASENPRFDRARFLAACGLED